MYRKDFSKYSNTNFEMYNVGWLSSEYSYELGNSSSLFIEKLSSLYKRERVNVTRGITYCPFCFSREAIYLKESGTEKLLGIAEIWVPNKEHTKIFAVPDLIIHYVSKHDYSPPQEFIDAVMDFDLNSDWSGEEAYKACMKDVYGEGYK